MAFDFAVDGGNRLSWRHGVSLLGFTVSVQEACERCYSSSGQHRKTDDAVKPVKAGKAEELSGHLTTTAAARL